MTSCPSPCRACKSPPSAPVSRHLLNDGWPGAAPGRTRRPGRAVRVSAVRRSLAYSLADSYLGIVLQLATTAIISRLLSPTEIGIFAVAAVLAALASTFRDFGVAEYLIQEKSLTPEKIRAAFAANLIVSWAMAILLFASSGMAADFYRQPGVAEVMRIQSINFVLIPFGAVTMAYFRRELNFRPMFVAGLLANITMFAVANTAALMGVGYLSMAWSSLAGVVVTVATSIIMRPKDFPSMPSLRGIGVVARFGKHASGIYLFGQVGKSAPEAVIGRALDMASVAFFSRANALIEIFSRTVLRAVLPLCLPYFATAAREGRDPKVGYLRATAMLTGIGWPFFVVMGAAAYSTIRLLYGGQWVDAVPLAQVLCLAAMLELPYYLAKEALIAAGRVDRSNLLQFLVQGLRLCGLVLVVPYGLAGACWGLVVAAAAGGITAQVFLHRTIGLGVLDLARSSSSSVLVTVACGAPVWLAAAWLGQDDSNYVRMLAIAGASAGPAWIASLWAFDHPLWRELKGLADKALLKLRRGSGSA